MVEQTVESLGRLDILVNNAAVTFVGDIDIPLRRHDLVLAIDLDAPLVAARHAVPHLRAAGEGRILNVSSLAALEPIPGLMSYGMAKVALERLTVDLARHLARDRIAVNCFRIDTPVASEGFVANMPSADHGDWESAEVAVEGITWMLGRPTDYSGRLESMTELARTHGIMGDLGTRTQPRTTMFTGVYADRDIGFIDG